MWPLVFALITFIVPWSFRKKIHPHEIRTMATSLGIGFTFLGIVIALRQLNLSPENLASNISSLLNGLYIAFTSSIVGIGVSIWAQIKPSYWRKEESLDEAVEETDIDALILDEIKKMNRAISGDDNSSLITRLEKIQLSVTEKQDELKKSFDAFAKKMADNNMKALEEVIRQFNQQLQEQFGENFKKLDESVKKLLDWQENYKNIVEKNESELQEVRKVLDVSRKNMEKSDEVIASILEKAQAFSGIAKELEEQLKKTASAMSSISSLSENLSGRAEKISEEMEKLTKQSLQDLGSKLKAISEALVRDYQYVQEAMVQIRKNQNQ